MEKTKLLIKVMAVVAIAFLAVGIPQANATDKTYQLSAVVPSATGATFAAYRVINDGSSTTDWSSLGTTTALDFGTLTLKSAVKNGITFQWFASNYFFAIDISPNGGGVLNHTITYTEGVKPTGQTQGLGYKSVAKFTQTQDGTADVAITSKLLKDTLSYSVNGSTFSAGKHLRVYLSLFDGVINAGLTGGSSFNPSDKPGSYAGTLTITAVIP